MIPSVLLLYWPTSGAPQSASFEASGGALAGGASSLLFIRSAFVASAGGVAGGAADTEWFGPVVYAHTMTGGGVAGATADLLFLRQNIVSSGGAVAGGTSPMYLPSDEVAPIVRKSGAIPWPTSHKPKKKLILRKRDGDRRW